MSGSAVCSGGEFSRRDVREKPVSDGARFTRRREPSEETRQAGVPQRVSGFITSLKVSGRVPNRNKRPNLALRCYYSNARCCYYYSFTILSGGGGY